VSRYRGIPPLLWGIYHRKVSEPASINESNSNLWTLVGDYTLFLRKWTVPHGGIQGYLRRFLDSGDATFQHIAIWTLLQLLESEDKRLIEKIHDSQDIVHMVQGISEKGVDSDDDGDVDDSESGENEVVGLAKKCLELLGMPGTGKSLVEG